MRDTKKTEMSTRHLAVRILISTGLVLVAGSFFTGLMEGTLQVVGVALVVAGLVVLAPHDPPAG